MRLGIVEPERRGRIRTRQVKPAAAPLLLELPAAGLQLKVDHRQIIERQRQAGGQESQRLRSLIRAKKLADAMGGLDKARAALDVLARLV